MTTTKHVTKREVAMRALKDSAQAAHDIGVTSADCTDYRPRAHAGADETVVYCAACGLLLTRLDLP